MVHTGDGPRNVEAMIDTGGAVNIASRHLLTNILPAKKRGNPHCRLVTVNGLTSPYNEQGELERIAFSIVRRTYAIRNG